MALTDKVQILAYLQTDRLYAAYAVGDLEPGMFEQSTWAGAQQNGALQALVLYFRGLALPALLLMGIGDGVRAILQNVLRPARVFLNCREEHVPVAGQFYRWEEITPMWRMVLQPPQFRPAPGECVRLGVEHYDALTALYALGGGDAFDRAQLMQGVFCGVREGGRLVAAAGTHLVSPTYGVAALGNVFTHPQYRRRGLAAAAASAVVAELLQRGIRDIVLNVSQGNATAIHVYERLGFWRYCPYVEGSASTLTA